MRAQFKPWRFITDEDGAALVEFGFLLPTLLLFFALTVEGSRTFWSYQATIAGVRDAARYLGRAAPVDICTTGGSVAGYTDHLTRIVRESVDGAAIFPSSIRVDAVRPTLACWTGHYRLATVPVGTVTATLTIDYPFAGAFGLFGFDLGAVTTTVTDTSRVFGT